MAAESRYQSKIMRGLEAVEGKAINGTYTKKGEADIQGGYPISGRLYYIAVEVKTEDNYYRVMQALEEMDNRYIVTNPSKLKAHEALQVHKINEVRDLGGLALFAYSFEQVEDYVQSEITKGTYAPL